MAHFALVDRGIVKQVIVAEQEYIDTAVFNEPGTWVQCSYNTVLGVHWTSMDGDRTPSEDQSKALRYNFPSPGWLYDGVGFYSPKDTFPESFTFDSNKYMWVAPADYPEDGQKYIWNEDNVSWEVLPEDDAWMDTYTG